MNIQFWGVTALPPDGSAARDMVNTHIQNQLDACGWRFYPTGTKLDFDFSNEAGGGRCFEVGDIYGLLSEINEEVGEAFDGADLLGDGAYLFLMYVTEDGKIHAALVRARHDVSVSLHVPGSLEGMWKEPG